MSPLFEDFPRFFQKSYPQVHILYDKMFKMLLKLMIRFLKKSTYENMPGREMLDVDYGKSNQLSDTEVVLGGPAKKATKA